MPAARKSALQWSPVRGSSEDVTLLRAARDIIASTYTPMDPSQLGLSERLPQRVSIRPLEQWLSLDTRRRERAYQVVFGLTMSKICPPYETEYCEWKDPTHRAQRLADVSGFYCAFGLEPSRRVPERADNIALEIEFVAFLIEKLLSLRRTADRGSAEHEAVWPVMRHVRGLWRPRFRGGFPIGIRWRKRTVNRDFRLRRV